MITLIVSIDNHYGISTNGKLLAVIPEDMKHFKEKTLNQIVVMGRTTWFSLPVRKQKSLGIYNLKGELLKEKNYSTHALKNRINIVLSHTKEGDFYGASLVTDNIDDILKLAETNNVFIIGGGSIYKQFYQYADIIELTVFGMFNKKADVFFPAIHHSDFIVQNSYVLQKDDFDLTFLTLVRRNKQ